MSGVIFLSPPRAFMAGTGTILLYFQTSNLSYTRLRISVLLDLIYTYTQMEFHVQIRQILYKFTWLAGRRKEPTLLRLLILRVSQCFHQPERVRRKKQKDGLSGQRLRELNNFLRLNFFMGSRQDLRGSKCRPQPSEARIHVTVLFNGITSGPYCEPIKSTLHTLSRRPRSSELMEQTQLKYLLFENRKEQASLVLSNFIVD